MNKLVTSVSFPKHIYEVIVYGICPILVITICIFRYNCHISLNSSITWQPPGRFAVKFITEIKCITEKVIS